MREVIILQQTLCFESFLHFGVSVAGWTHEVITDVGRENRVGFSVPAVVYQW